MSKTNWGSRAGMTDAERHQERVARRFRRHVRTKWNPKGQIHRERCVFETADGGCSESQAHHIDYTRPFAITWVCETHHRAVERGSLKLHKRHIFDYASLLEPLLVKARQKGPEQILRTPPPSGVPF